MLVAMRLDRRQLLSTLAVAGAHAVAPALAHAKKPPRQRLKRLQLEVGDEQAVVREAVALVPAKKAKRPLPVVIFLHGFAEAKDAKRALAAWPRDYGLLTAHSALSAPPLPIPGKKALLKPERAAEISQELKQRPLSDVVLVCPRTPVPYRVVPGKDLLASYAGWLLDELLPKLAKHVPLDPARRGLVGFSMGGRVALQVLNRRPGAFHSFTALQAELLKDQGPYFARRVAQAMKKDRSLRVRILTAHGDPSLSQNRLLARTFKTDGFTTELSVLGGQHKAQWVREVGALEALFGQERALRQAG